MLFNSLSFALFLPLVFGLYWGVLGRSYRAQNTLLLVASCWFYMAFVPVYILILAFTIAVDYIAGLLIERSTGKRRKAWLIASIIANVGVLAVFKYWNFLNHNIGEVFQALGLGYGVPDLGLLLPIGLSFHTFQSLAYTIEVYRGTQAAEKRLGVFALYVMFFPQLVAGPIERAGNLLPQFVRPRTFDLARASDGMRQILWGFFKKSVIADNCAPLVKDIFENHDRYGGSTLLFGAVLFAFQIYGDFGGYSDIAIGSARLLGFDLMRNFAFPYFSRDIAEFWRRWHISLSTWFRDYVYFPLGGSRGSRWMQVRNIMVIFLLSGLWHGANWTFVVWGAFNALLFLPLLLSGRNRVNLDHAGEGRLFPRFRELAGMVFTFGCVVIAWVFFRAPTLHDAFDYLRHMASWSLFSPSHLFDPWITGLIAVLLIAEWLNRTRHHALEIAHLPAWSRRMLYLGVFLLIFVFGRFAKDDFIYFQF